MPPSLETAVLKTLMKDPTERFADCSLFLEILRSALPLAPVFPLGGSPRSRNRSVDARPAQVEGANRHMSPIRRHAAKRLARQTAQRMTSKQREQFAVSSDVEVERAEPETTLSAFNASSPELAGIVPPSEDLASSFQLTSPLSGETNHLDRKAYEEDAPDLAFPDPFLTEEEDALSTIAASDVEYKKNDQTEKEMNLTLTGRNDIYAPHPKQPSHKGRRIVQVIFLFVIIGLLAYAFEPSLMSTTPKTSVRVTDKKQPIILSIPMQAVPTQTLQASATTTPSAYSFVLVTPTKIITPMPTPTPTPTLIPTPIPTPTPTSTPIPRISYEAESSQNTWTGFAGPVSCSGCSGGYRVCCLSTQSNGQNGTLQFNDVDKSIAGSYTMTIYYTEGDPGSRTGYVSVNGGAAITFTGVYTGNWDTVEAINMTISLSAGNNTIEFFNPNGPGPDIDRVVV